MPIQVHVRLLGVFQSLTGRGRLLLELEEPAVVRIVVQKLVESFPEFNRVLIDPELNETQPNVLILVNGKEISVLERLKTKVKEGDEVVLIPVSHGG